MHFQSWRQRVKSIATGTRRLRRRRDVRRTISDSWPQIAELETRTLLAAGSLDPSFGVGGEVTTDFPVTQPTHSAPRGIAVQSDGKIVEVGGASRLDAAGNSSASDFAVARYNEDGSLDRSFGTGGRVTINLGAVDAIATSVVMQGDKIVVAGHFIDNGAVDSAVARLNADGSLDDSFASDGRLTIDFGSREDEVRGVAVQGDKIVLVGDSLRADGSSRDFHVVRLNADGTPDDSFAGDGQETIDFGLGSHGAIAWGVAVQGDKIVVGGSADGGSVVARLNPNGSLDDSFDGDGRQTIDIDGDAMALQGDKIVVAGTSVGEFAVTRLNADGSLDESFDGDGKQTIDFTPNYEVAQGTAVHDVVNGIAVLGDQIVLAGYSEGFQQVDVDSFEQHDQIVVMRLNGDGTLDDSFDGDGKQTIDFGRSVSVPQGVAVQGDKTVVDCESDQGGFAVARLNTDGTLDGSFDGDGKVLTEFLAPVPGSVSGEQILAGTSAVQADGKIVVGGYSLRPGNEYVLSVARYNADGSLDRSFGDGGLVTIDFGASVPNGCGVALQGDKIVVGGSIVDPVTGFDFAVARLNADGSLDDSFDGDGRQTIDFGSMQDEAYGIAVQGDKIVLAGYSNQSATGFDFDFAVARLNGDGTLDDSFDGDGRLTIDFGSMDDDVVGLALQGDKIVLAGYSDQGATGYDFAVARINADGTLDDTFAGDGKETVDFDSPADFAYGVALQGDKIVLVGFSDRGAADFDFDFAVARLNADGTLDDSFDGDGRQTIDFGTRDDEGSGVALQGDKIVVAGYTSNVATGYDFAVARLNADGTLDDSFADDGRQTIDFGSMSDFGWGVVLQGGRIVAVGYSNQGATGNDFALGALIGNVNTPPVADAGGTYTVVPGGTVQLDATASSDPDQTSTSLTYDWDLDDDGLFDDATGVAPVFSATGIDTIGTRTIAVRVTDAGGLTSVATTTVNIVPTALLPDPGDPGKTALFVGGTLGTDTISVDAGTLAGTLRITVNSTVYDNLTADGETFIYGLAGDDTIVVNAALPGGLVVAGQEGSDTYTVNFGALAGPVRIADDGAAGADDLTVNGTAGDDHIFKDATTVTLLGPAPETVVFTGIEVRNVHGGAGNDLITDPGSDTFLFGDAGNDTIVISATAGSGIVADGGGGSDTYIVAASGLAGPVVIADTGTTGSDSLTVQGTAGDDTIVQTATGLTVNGVPVAFSGALESLTVDGGGGSDGFTVVGTPSVPVQVQGVADMIVKGTAGNDTIVFTPSGSAGRITARLNGVIVAQFAPTGRLIAYGGDGNDTITADGCSIALEAHGGAGNDTITGSNGDDVLLGDDGKDILTGGAGHDVLVGGAGADRLVGSAGHDILIAGEVLDAVFVDYDRFRDDWLAAVAATGANLGDGQEIAEAVIDETLIDNDVDQLTGSSGADLFIISLGDEVTDLGKLKKLTSLDDLETADGDVVQVV